MRDRACQAGRARKRPARPGVEMPSYWQVYRLRDGRAVRVEIYRERAAAFEAVGLSE